MILYRSIRFKWREWIRCDKVLSNSDAEAVAIVRANYEDATDVCPVRLWRRYQKGLKDG